MSLSKRNCSTNLASCSLTAFRSSFLKWSIPDPRSRSNFVMSFSMSVDPYLAQTRPKGDPSGCGPTTRVRKSSLSGASGKIAFVNPAPRMKKFGEHRIRSTLAPHSPLSMEPAGRGFVIKPTSYLAAGAALISSMTMAWEPPRLNTLPLITTFSPANFMSRSF